MTINSLAKELLTTRLWNIEYATGLSLSRQLAYNINNHIPLSAAYGDTQAAPHNTQLLIRKAAERKKFKEQNAVQLVGDPMLKEQAEIFAGQLLIGNATEMHRWRCVDEDDEVINLVHVEGPITREGGACSYGSKEIRDEMLYAAKMPQTIGHIFLINSPGGSCYAANDFEMAIDAAKEAGQPTIGLIDGSCYSAALWLAARLDEVYYVHPQCGIGSVGAMCAFFTNKDGDENVITKERLHIVYAKDSFDKNAEMRESSEGDDTKVEADVAEAAKMFMDDMKRLRPNTPEEWLHGKTFKCHETDGIWTNGRNDLNGCIERILALHGNVHNK